MKEDLLHYAWKTQRFEQQGLATIDGAPIEVLHPGFPNADQGPDFLQARLRIGGTQWAGSVEIHVDGSDWFAHTHHEDPGYNNVVLHVVARPGKRPPLRADGTTIPELSLENRLDVALLRQYQALSASEAPFPCAHLVYRVPEVFVRQWVHLVGWERILKKVEALEARLADTRYDWEQLIWQELAGAMGGKVNKEAFQELAHAVPVRVLRAHRDELPLLEALLLGGAGFLETEPTDAYSAALARDWQHLAHKWSLRPLPNSRFRFARLRPVNFPTVRLAQLAAFAHLHPSLLEVASRPAALAERAGTLLPSEYWLTHYRLGAETARQPKALGRQFADSLLINCLVPVSVLYFKILGRPVEMEGQMELLQDLQPEDNTLTRRYAIFGLKAQSALDSQGLIGLEREYCLPKRCLYCGIGHRVLSQNLAENFGI